MSTATTSAAIQQQQDESHTVTETVGLENEYGSLSHRLRWRRLMFTFFYWRSKLTSAGTWKTWLTGPEALGNVYLVVWFALNILITLLSKATFTNFRFPYPMMLTAVHLGITWLGSQTASSLRLYNTQSISIVQLRGLIVFSIVFTVNIWLSNYALMVVSVSVHQVFRTTIPLFTMLLSLVLYKEVYPLRMLPSVLLVIVGVCATLWGDLDMTIWGGIVVALGCAFSSLKGLMSQKAQIGAQGLETFDLLRAVCPMAVAELFIWGCLNGEVSRLMHDKEFNRGTAWSLFMQGLLAFSLNFVSFKCAALKNPLTMNIAGNVKQVITPLVAIWLGLGGSLTLALITGLVLTFAGALWYGNEANKRKEALKAASAKAAQNIIVPEQSTSCSVQMVMASGSTHGTLRAPIQSSIGAVTIPDSSKTDRLEMNGRIINPKTIAAPDLAEDQP